MTKEEIIQHLPYSHPFLFVDEIISFDQNEIVGVYTYDKDLPFYKGHFKDNPITPGVILTETMAQIGLVCFGITLVDQTKADISELKVALTSTEIDFYLPVLPGEKVVVKSVQEFFRFSKLKCYVEMYNAAGELVCRGKIAGMLSDYGK